MFNSTKKTINYTFIPNIIEFYVNTFYSLHTDKTNTTNKFFLKTLGLHTIILTV